MRRTLLPPRRAPAARLLAAVLLAAAALPGTPQDAAAQTATSQALAFDGADLPVVEHTLANGMRFLVLRRDTSPTVSFVVHVPAGSVNEALGSTGTAHMLEHLLFKGSTTVGTADVEAERRLFQAMDAVHDSLRGARGRASPLPADTAATRARSAELARLAGRLRILEDSARGHVVPNEFDEILSRSGARGLNASTSYETTEYYVELPANRAELWFVLEADRMRNPVFREFFAERDVVEEERRARLESDPGGRLWETFMGTAFRVHPYGVAPIGHMDDIRNLGRPRVEAFYRDHYGPGNTVVAIVGAIEPDSALVWAEAYFGPLEPRGPPPPLLVQEPEQRGERRIEVLDDAEPQFMVGWKVGGGDDPELPALSMLANVLVGGRDARLYRRLVRDERIASFVTAGLSPGGRDPGLFTIQAGPLAPHAPEALEAAIDDELRRLVAEPPSAFELERVRTRLEAARVRRLVSNLGLAFQLAGSTAAWDDWRRTFEIQARMQAVTADDIVAAAERYLVREGRTVGVLRRPEAP
jgi:predicted Zn-dependent peptidase